MFILRREELKVFFLVFLIKRALRFVHALLREPASAAAADAHRRVAPCGTGGFLRTLLVFIYVVRRKWSCVPHEKNRVACPQLLADTACSPMRFKPPNQRLYASIFLWVVLFSPKMCCC